MPARPGLSPEHVVLEPPPLCAVNARSYLISQRRLVEVECRPVALAHVQRHVAGFEGLLHAQLAAAHQAGGYTSARRSCGTRARKRTTRGGGRERV